MSSSGGWSRSPPPPTRPGTSTQDARSPRSGARAGQPAPSAGPPRFDVEVVPFRPGAVHAPIRPAGAGWAWGVPTPAAEFRVTCRGGSARADEVEVTLLRGGSVYFQERLTGSFTQPDVFHSWPWNGRDQRGVLDTRELRKGGFTVRVAARRGGQPVAQSETRFPVRIANAPDWLDVRLESATRTALATLGVKIRYALKLRHMAQVTGLGAVQWIDPFARDLEDFGAVMSGYERNALAALLQSGVQRYWSRRRGQPLAGGGTADRSVTIGGHATSVTAQADLRDSDAIAVDLFWVEPNRYMRSMKSTLAVASIYYNAGRFTDPARADLDFEAIAGHELGHSILRETNSFMHSVTHKGSTGLSQSVVASQTGHPFAPAEIDLMQYYDRTKDANGQRPPDYYDRLVAAEADVAALLAIPKLRFGL